MNGELAQLVALVSHAKVALASRDATDRLTLASSPFQFVHSVRFHEARAFLRFGRAREVATSPDSWCEYLRRTAVQSVELLIWAGNGQFADHIMAALSGGGNWGIRTIRPGSSTLWIPRWSPDRPKDPERRIWAVSYRESRALVSAPVGLAIALAADQLREVLGQARDFARDAQLSTWADGFAEADVRLSAEPVTYSYHPDMLPQAGYGLPARQLLSACEKAWVFGGMGSWNDLGFQEAGVAERYQSITTALYRAVTAAVVSAVNSFPAVATTTTAPR